MSTRKKYSKEFKRDAISLVKEQGYSRAAAAHSLGINPAMLSRWIRQHDTDDGTAFRVRDPSATPSGSINPIWHWLH